MPSLDGTCAEVAHGNVGRSDSRTATAQAVISKPAQSVKNILKNWNVNFARENVCNHLASSGVIMKGSELLLRNDRFRDCAHIGTW